MRGALDAVLNSGCVLFSMRRPASAHHVAAPVNVLQNSGSAHAARPER
jgi:hypothetical protein